MIFIFSHCKQRKAGISYQVFWIVGTSERWEKVCINVIAGRLWSLHWSLGLICRTLLSHHCEQLLEKKLAILSISSTAVHRQALGKRRPWGNAGPLEPCLRLGSHCCYPTWGWTSRSNKTRTGDETSVQTPAKRWALTLAWFWDTWETSVPPSLPNLLLTWNSPPYMPAV